MTEKIDLHEVAGFIAGLPKYADVDDFLRAVARRFPKVTVGEVGAVAQAEEHEAEAKAGLLDVIAHIAPSCPERAERLKEVLERRPMTSEEVGEVGELLAARQTEIGLDLAEWEHAHRAAEAGDLTGVRAVMNSPGFRIFIGKRDAAAERHPDWSRNEDGEWIGPATEDHPDGDTVALIAWFERTFPVEAARITAAVFAGDDDDPPPLAA